MPNTTRVEVTNKQIKSFKLGQSVTVQLTGKITELEAERSFEDVALVGSGKKGKKETFPPQVTIDVSKTSVKADSNQFDDLIDD